MALCISCGLQLRGDAVLCPHHSTEYDSIPWSEGNRIMCDFFHRKKLPSRLQLHERGDDFWLQAVEDRRV